MTEAPKVIYLQFEEPSQAYGVEWSEGRINDSDVAYIRHDVVLDTIDETFSAAINKS